jgi:hypothetical protein
VDHREDQLALSATLSSWLKGLVFRVADRASWSSALFREFFSIAVNFVTRHREVARSIAWRIRILILTVIAWSLPRLLDAMLFDAVIKIITLE